MAAGMNDNLVTPVTGESSFVLLSSPNAHETNSLRSTRSLANLLAACVRNVSVTSTFLDLTKPPRGPAPRSTAQALAAHQSRLLQAEDFWVAGTGSASIQRAQSG